MHRRFIALAYRPDRRYRKHLHWMIDPPDVALRQPAYGYYLKRLRRYVGVGLTALNHEIPTMMAFWDQSFLVGGRVT